VTIPIVQTRAQDAGNPPGAQDPVRVGSYWFSDKIVLRLYRAREASPQQAPVLYQTVRGLAQLFSTHPPLEESIRRLEVNQG